MRLLRRDCVCAPGAVYPGMPHRRDDGQENSKPTFHNQETARVMLQRHRHPSLHLSWHGGLSTLGILDGLQASRLCQSSPRPRLLAPWQRALPLSLHPGQLPASCSIPAASTCEICRPLQRMASTLMPAVQTGKTSWTSRTTGAQVGSACGRFCGDAGPATEADKGNHLTLLYRPH